MRRRSTLVSVAVALGCLLASCVGPARTHEDYALKAKSTAATTLSAVNTSRLAAELAGRRRAFSTYLSVLSRDAEEEASSAQTAFDSIQPPGKASDQLRSQMDDLLTNALDPISNVRIAIRRGHLDEAAAQQPALAKSARDLQRFIEAQP